MILELRNIGKYYENAGLHIKRQILEGLSLSINLGDAIAIIGPSGSGKSTLLNIMGTLDTPTSGNVLFNGLDVSSLNEKELSITRNHHIGFVFQRHYLFPQLNLIENVLIPVLPNKDNAKKKAALSRGLELLESVGLSDKAYQFPGQLSVGECQRAAVVRALINEPELILADEPTGSLDHHSATQLGNLLLTIKITHPIALVIVTHSSELAGNMQVIYKLIDGKLEFSADQ